VRLLPECHASASSMIPDRKMAMPTSGKAQADANSGPIMAIEPSTINRMPFKRAIPPSAVALRRTSLSRLAHRKRGENAA
jgi:hypothetical protein